MLRLTMLWGPREGYPSGVVASCEADDICRALAAHGSPWLTRVFDGDCPVPVVALDHAEERVEAVNHGTDLAVRALTKIALTGEKADRFGGEALERLALVIQTLYRGAHEKAP